MSLSNTMNICKPKMYTICGGLLVYVFVEYVLHKKRNYQLKNQKIVHNTQNIEKRLKLLESDILLATGKEKEHFLITLKKTFKSFTNKDAHLTDLVHHIRMCNDQNNIHEKPQLLFPISLQIFCSFLNKLCLLKWFLKYKYVSIMYNNKLKFVRIFPKKMPSNGTFLIFGGMNGLLLCLNELIHIILEKNYDIIIPIYAPAQASLEHNLESHNEINFQSDIFEFLHVHSISKISLAAWSLGGVHYLGFESMSSLLNISIEKVFLFEPLLCNRSIIDKRFTYRRSWSDSFQVINHCTPDLNYKYIFFNSIFAYFLHTILVYGLANSTDYLHNIEYKNAPMNYSYPRYLFVSDNDFIINRIVDKHFIEKRFDKLHVFSRKGYHGGWMKSKRLYNTFANLI